MSLTANSASIAGLAATIRAGGLAIANRAASPSQSAGASRRVESRGFLRRLEREVQGRMTAANGSMRRS